MTFKTMKTLLAFATVSSLAYAATMAFAQYAVPPATMGEPQPVIVESPAGIAAPFSSAAASPFLPGMPADARKIAAKFESDVAGVRRDARRQIRKLRVALAASLEKLQKQSARDAQLDEAVAIRDCIRGLGGIQPIADPGTLFAYANSIGRPLYFRVTGERNNPVWGSNPYTPDSALSSAVVHAGLLKAGETGVVKVTMLQGQPSYPGSKKNGITSSKWGNSPASYLVEAVTERDEDAEESGRSYTPPVQPLPAPAGSYGGSSGYVIARPVYESRSYSATPAMPEWNGSRRAVVYVGPGPVRPSSALPGDAQRLVDDFQSESVTIHRAENRKIAALRRAAIASLKPLQDKYTRDSRLDEAVTIRDYIGSLRQSPENALSDPGNLGQYAGAVGRVFNFRVTGQRGGSVWGSGMYTTDSTLATAAVHSGALREGQTGVVKVSILPGQVSYMGTFRNGVNSMNYGNYPTSYRVESSDADEDASAEDDSRRNPASATDNKNLARQVEDLRREVTRLDRSLREVLLQLKQRHEEEEVLKKGPATGR